MLRCVLNTFVAPFVSILIQADDYAKGLIALGLKRGDTMTSFGVVSAETLFVSVAAISLGIGYSVII